MRALRAVDFFCDEPAEDDPLGEELLTRFLAFARELSAAREGGPEIPCRLTVITRRAAFDVASPRGPACGGRCAPSVTSSAPGSTCAWWT